MEIAITSTDEVTTLDGVPCRVWDGITAQGTPCKVFVHRVAVAKDEDTEAFDRELLLQLPPGRAVDLRQIL